MDATQSGNDMPGRNYRWWMVGPDGAARAPRWWIQDILIATFVAGAIGGLLLIWQESIDERRSEREILAARLQSLDAESRENLRFVRDRSGDSVMDRPFQNMVLWEANLSGLQLEGANFRGAEFGEFANFEGTNLRGADLREANLRQSTLIDVILADANLREANLYDSLLGRANLVGADLRGADLSYADLSGADLRRAKLDSDGLATVCHDEDTVWPDNFEPPNADGLACNPYQADPRDDG